ncbi:ATP-binding protein [Trinickia sp. NRRL B-1857]|uniref:sensor histidine kinase n=1 Tax=Trinickia sp. NRRL B-1857 TaxID=3162879 RepID=UPI003D28C54C
MARDPVHTDRLAMLGRAVAFIVHDALQPVGSALTRGQSALRWLRRDPPDVAAAIASLERLVEDVQRASATLSALRKLASPTAGPKLPLSLNALLSDSVRWLEDELRHNGIDVALELVDGDVQVMAARVALQQLIVNLIVNAIEAMVENSVATRRLTVALSVEGRNAVIAVSDTGRGIATHAVPHLFDAFYTTKEGGTGMGLAICRRIVTEHAGSLEAVSPPEGGARFVVRVPRLGTCGVGASER